MSYYSPKDVELFKMFNIEYDDFGHDLWCLIPYNFGGNIIIDRDASSHLTREEEEAKLTGMSRSERVDYLRQVYERYEPQDLTPFDLNITFLPDED